MADGDDTPDSLFAGRYRLGVALGQGGMADVYAAWDTLQEVDRAIKVMRPTAAQSERQVERFLREARTMARLEHPNLVRVLDMGRDGDQVYLVMELLKGGDLTDRLVDSGAFAPREAARITIDALRGLQAAHDAGVIHRDLKPQNLILDDQGRARIADFGIARDLAGDGHTRTGARLGTWTYMPPEQRDDPRKVGPPSDVYAMGATLYALVTARRPVDLYVHTAREARIAHLPAPLAAVLRRACAYRPEDRYPSADAMAADLEGALPLLPDEPVSTAVAESDPESIAVERRRARDADDEDEPLLKPVPPGPPAALRRAPAAVDAAPEARTEAPRPDGRPPDTARASPERPRWPLWAGGVAVLGAVAGFVGVMSWAGGEADPTRPERLARPPAESATLEVDVQAADPASVSLWVDAQPVGLDSARQGLAVSPGPHTVRLTSSDGAVLWSGPVEVSEEAPAALCLDADRGAPCAE